MNQKVLFLIMIALTITFFSCGKNKNTEMENTKKENTKPEDTKKNLMKETIPCNSGSVTHVDKDGRGKIKLEIVIKDISGDTKPVNIDTVLDNGETYNTPTGYVIVSVSVWDTNGVYKNIHGVGYSDRFKTKKADNVNDSFDVWEQSSSTCNIGTDIFIRQMEIKDDQ